MTRLRAVVGALLVLGATAACGNDVGSSGDQGFVSSSGFITRAYQRPKREDSSGSCAASCGTPVGAT